MRSQFVNGPSNFLVLGRAIVFLQQFLEGDLELLGREASAFLLAAAAAVHF